MATLVDYEARNRRPPTGPSSATTSSASYRKPRKAIIESDPEDDDTAISASVIEKLHPSSTTTYTMDTDISQLEAPTFTTIDRGPSKTMLNLKWDHTVNLVGKKVVNPMIHCCDACLKPILIYGRMIPCKHVFCLNCATNQSVKCSRCGDKVSRVEPVGLGSIYMCSHGGSRYGNSGCRRTYLSQRDLQAHIQHRHMKNSVQIASAHTNSATGAVSDRKESRGLLPQNVNFHDSNAPSVQEVFRTQAGARNTISYPPSTQPQNYSQPPPSHISVISGGTRSSNLITVPIHDSSTSRDQPLVTSHPPPSLVASQYTYGQTVSGSSANFTQPPPAPSQGHFYATNQPPSYSDNGQSQYSSQWRTNNSSYYRR